MAQSIEDRIREYRSIASQKQAQKARAQAELDAAEERLAQARADLAEEFGVTTPEDARTLMAKLQQAITDAEAELAEAEKEIEAQLAEAGA